MGEGLKPTSELQEYNFAVEQGFQGSFVDYKRTVAEATRKPESAGGDTFTNTQINNGAATAGMPIADFKKLDADTKNFFINKFLMRNNFSNLPNRKRYFHKYNQCSHFYSANNKYKTN